MQRESPFLLHPLVIRGGGLARENHKNRAFSWTKRLVGSVEVAPERYECKCGIQREAMKLQRHRAQRAYKGACLICVALRCVAVGCVAVQAGGDVAGFREMGFLFPFSFFLPDDGSFSADAHVAM